jgi:hypothetical protein
MRTKEVASELKVTETSLSSCSSLKSNENCVNLEMIGTSRMDCDRQARFAMKMPYFGKSAANTRIIRLRKDKVIFTQETLR